MSDTDLQLLARYVRQNAEEAFAEIVRRHIDLVHSAALRQVRSSQLAEEVAQSVFIDLARQAERLAPDTIVTAWLYEVTRRTAIDAVRREARRQLREQIATEMNAMNAAAADWTHIEPLLDEAMHALDETDRAAVLLRYFENKSLREVGTALGTSDDTAQKRVSRAVERLRDFFVRRGVGIGVGGIAAVLSTNAAQAAPAGLAATVSAVALSTGATTLLTSTSIIIMKSIYTKLLVALVALLALVGGVHFMKGKRTDPISTPPANNTAQQLTMNEKLFQEMTNAYIIASEVLEGHPVRNHWEDCRAALLQAGYIETRDVPFPKVVKGSGRDFFQRFHSRFAGVEILVTGLNGQTPPIAQVTARKTDFGPTGAIEQFIRSYDSATASVR